MTTSLQGPAVAHSGDSDTRGIDSQSRPGAEGQVRDNGPSRAGVPAFRNLIGGRWVDVADGPTFENRNPARWDEVLGVFPRSTAADVELAVASARRGFESWRNVPAPKRGEILRRSGDLLTARKDEIAERMTREMGKVLAETRGDVQEAIDTAYYAATEGRRLFSNTVPSELPRKWAMAFRRPVGVAAIVTPWNFPLAVPSWKIYPALLCGNAVVWKPAEETPETAAVFCEILLEAGVHPEAVNLVFGYGEEAGQPLVESPGIDVISFTGSTGVGREIGARAGRQLKGVSLELGGKNGQLVLDDADLELALEGVLWGAFGTTGQRCTATSRLLLQDGIHDGFLAELERRAAALRLGDGLDPRSQVGPIINEKQRHSIHGYVAVGREEGAELRLGGELPDAPDLAGGWFYPPTILAGVRPGMRVEQEEIFGPVLSVIRVRDFEEGVQVLNDTQYGLSSSVYTRDVARAFEAMERIEAGITYVNSPTIGAEAHLPFGGVKNTGNGHREGGWAPYTFFSEEKTVYVDYSGRLQKAQIDTHE
ncbi:MAG: aldehyde dehydrogenase family protein [Gemmatimonadetes bacterium]|nr:aldehyde dehydrogenase family protein [Gemmatimonadota bacterium]